jgi:hypothetical protein
MLPYNLAVRYCRIPHFREDSATAERPHNFSAFIQQSVHPFIRFRLVAAMLRHAPPAAVNLKSLNR